MPVVTLAVVLAGALCCSLALAQAGCVNPSPLPSGYAAPCPVWSVSPASVSQSGSLSLSATPQPGTDYIYTTAYYAKGSTWLPTTLTGNNAAPSYSTAIAQGTLTPAILQTLTPGTNYIVLWDWLWDVTAGCYKGPGLNQCNTGTWRLQVFSLTQSTSGAAVSISPTTLTFPSTQVGMTSPTQYVTVVNTGTTAISSTLSSFTGDFYSAGTGTCGLSLAVGSSCLYSVHFTPTAAGTRTGTLTINDNAPGAPHIINLSGTGSSAYTYSQATYTTYTYSQSAYTSGCTSGCTNYYITSTGSDSNVCTQASPCKTINGVDTKLGSSLPLGSAGTLIHVAAGNYSGPITTSKSGTSSARLVWLSDTKWGAKITTSNWEEFGSYVDVQGFDMTSPATGNNFAIDIHGVSIHILNNYMHDFDVVGCGKFGIVSLGSGGKNNWFIGNIVRHAGNYNVAGSVQACITMQGIYAFGAGDIIENNIISGMTGYALKKQMLTGGCGQSVISNNTFFNNGGGILFDENADTGGGCIFDYNTIDNNIIVNNGVDVPSGNTRSGVNWMHVTGTHNLFSNNMVYGNVNPSLGGALQNYAHHDVLCTGGTPISGTDADGTAGGCPSTNPKSDPSLTSTFANYQLDTNTAPASNYNPANYQLKSGSTAINNGTTQCASSPGLNPCTPTTDFSGKTRTAPIDIGAYEQ